MKNPSVVKGERITGASAQDININGAIELANIMRTTLGPKGMDKMIVTGTKDIIITNDGESILEELSVEQPGIKMLVELAKSQGEESGDGTTSAVVIAGELLKKGGELLKKGIHPSIITKGYYKALNIALKALNAHSEKQEGEETLKKIAVTSMTGKGNDSSKSVLAELAVKAVVSSGPYNISIEKKPGSSISQAELIKGLLIDKEKVHPGMPDSIKNARIAVLDAPLEVKETETESEIRIKDTAELNAYKKEEDRMMKKMVDDLLKLNVNVVFCQKGIDEYIQNLLAKKGIIAARRIKRKDIENICKATGAGIISQLSSASDEDIGIAGMVQEKRVGSDKMIELSRCENPKQVTILLKGGSDHIVTELKRTLNNAINNLKIFLKEPKIVPGAGSIEMLTSREVIKQALSMQSKEQLIIKAFGEALEVLPKSIAENAGMDGTDIITKLRADPRMGVDAKQGKEINPLKEGIIEPLRLKINTLTSATETAVMLLRIDDIISSGRNKKQR